MNHMIGLMQRQQLVITCSFAVLACLLLVMLHSQTLLILGNRWANDPTEEYGWLIPVIAGLLLVSRWRLQKKINWQVAPQAWIVLLVMSIIQSVWLPTDLQWLQVIAMIVMLGGIIVNLGGLKALKWAWPALIYLLLMVPCPASFELSLRISLEWINVNCACYFLQTCGIMAVADAGAIHLPSGEILACPQASILCLTRITFGIQLVFILSLCEQIRGRAIATINAMLIAVLTTGLVWIWKGIYIECVPDSIKQMIPNLAASWVIVLCSTIALAMIHWCGIRYLTIPTSYSLSTPVTVTLQTD